MNVVKNIGETYLKPVKRDFPNCNNFLKIFNKNTINTSKSCMINTSLIIGPHNKSILYPKTNEY